MNWIEKTNTKFKIQTGDGKIFEALWEGPQKTLEYNTTEFTFPEVGGALVKRRKPRARKFDLNFVFQGDNHLDTAEEFERSAEDERPWTLLHPIFGKIVVQPSSLTVDQSVENITRYTGQVIETILEDYPRAADDPSSKIQDDQLTLSSVFVENWEFTYKSSTESKSNLLSNLEYLRAQGDQYITDTESKNVFTNLYNEAFSQLQDATAEPVAQITAVQNFINSAASFPINVSTRLNYLTAGFNGLITAITTRSQKQVYENNASNLLASMALAAATPLSGNYTSRNQVLSIIDLIYSNWNVYLTNIDTFQSATNNSQDSYIPDPWGMFNLSNLINFTLSSLFSIALGAKQERVIYLTESSNAILLTHRFYGLDENDVNFNLFVETNEIGLNEVLNIAKGRRILYYI